MLSYKPVLVRDKYYHYSETEDQLREKKQFPVLPMSPIVG